MSWDVNSVLSEHSLPPADHSTPTAFVLPNPVAARKPGGSASGCWLVGALGSWCPLCHSSGSRWCRLCCNSGSSWRALSLAGGANAVAMEHSLAPRDPRRSSQLRGSFPSRACFPVRAPPPLTSQPAREMGTQMPVRGQGLGAHKDKDGKAAWNESGAGSDVAPVQHGH